MNYFNKKVFCRPGLLNVMIHQKMCLQCRVIHINHMPFIYFIFFFSGNAVENTDESHDVFSAKLDRQISTINPKPVKDESTTLLTPPPDIIVTTPRTSESLAKNFLTVEEVQQKCATNVNGSNAQNVVNGEVCLENEQYPNEEASTKSVSLTSENEQFITDSDKVHVKYYSKSPTKDVLDTSENEPLIGYSDTSVTEDTTLASTSESLSECDQSESSALI